MNDTLRYMARPHFYRHWHGDDIRFSSVYAFHENFILPISHDEVVYGKGSVIAKQPGDEWQRFAGLRTLYGYMWAHPGKKLLFMGCEFAQLDEWHHERTLDWHLWARPLHGGVARWIGDLNDAYRKWPALHVNDFNDAGFWWLPFEHHQSTLLAFARRAGPEDALVVAICNMTAEPRMGVRIGLPAAGTWYEILNSDAPMYGGSGVGNLGRIHAVDTPLGGQPASATLTVPPLGTLFLANRPDPQMSSSSPGDSNARQ
jgi:1,4-alpha-glucan branching enzyme